MVYYVATGTLPIYAPDVILLHHERDELWLRTLGVSVCLQNLWTYGQTAEK